MFGRRSVGRSAKRSARRSAGRLARHPAGRSSAARVSSAAPKKKSFDRDGPVWPPQSNVTNDRLRGGGLRGSASQPKSKIFRKKFEKCSILAGGRCPPDPPLNGRSSHLIEAAKRGRLNQMFFFSAPLTTRAPPGRPAGRPAERPAGRPQTTRPDKSIQPRY